MNEKLLSPKEVAERTSLHVETIRRFCRKGELAPIIPIGNRIRIPESTYKKFIESHSIKAKERQ